MMNIEDLRSGQFYLDSNGRLVYLLKILFEDTIQKFKHEMDEVRTMPTYDHIVYRIIAPGRYDMPHQGKYSWFTTKEKFIAEVDKEIFYNEKQNHYIIHNEKKYSLYKICSPAYTSSSVHSQAVPYKFRYKLVLGREYPDQKNNVYDPHDYAQLVISVAQSIGYQYFLHFDVVGASMYGGKTIQYGKSLWFLTEEDHNLARLILPIKF